MNLGDFVLDQIVANGLVRCVDLSDEPVIFVWQGNAAEIIEAAIQEYLKEHTDGSGAGS